MDTYHGFVEYDLVKNTKLTYDLSNKIPGYESNDKIFNSIRQDPTNSNVVYISISSTKYSYDKISMIFLELESSGLLIAFNKATKKVTILANGLTLANGVEITERSLLVNDLLNQRILKFDLKEVRSLVQSGRNQLPKSAVFKDKLPGYPDNLTKHGRHLFASLFFYLPNNDIFLEQIGSNIHVRKVAHRLLYLGNEALKVARKFYKCSCLDKLQHALESGRILMSLPYKSAVAILDKNTGDYIGLVILPINYITHAIYNPSTSKLYFGSIVHKSIYAMTFKI